MIVQDANDSEEVEYLLTAVLVLVSSATMEISIKIDEIDLPRVQMYHFYTYSQRTLNLITEIFFYLCSIMPSSL